jgi:quinol monooxygenase YgiN
MPEPGKVAAFVVIPGFVVKPDYIDAYLALALDDASHSVADEPGCRQFDVVQMEGAPHQVLLYADIRRRDARDSSRAAAPLRPAEDAALLDTTELDVEAAFRAALDLVEARRPGSVQSCVKGA